MARSKRAEWAKRVARWRKSGLTAREFSARIGVNPRTLSHWKWALKRDAESSKQGPGRRRANDGVEFVEVPVPASPWWTAESRLELVLGDGLVVRVPDGFDEKTLERVLEIVWGDS